MNKKISELVEVTGLLPNAYFPVIQGLPVDDYKISIDNLGQSFGVLGKSAYQVALDNGYIGTEEEWLLSLVGQQGETGLAGYTPIKGVDYFDGLNGKDGLTTSVNGVTQVNGEVTLDATDIPKAVTTNTDQNISGVKVFEKAYIDTTRILTLPTYTLNYSAKTITLSSIDAAIFSMPQGEGILRRYTIPVATLTLPAPSDGDKNAVYVDYNSGSPVYAITATPGVINSSDKIFVGEIYGYANQLYFLIDLTQYRWGSTRYMRPISSTIGGDVWGANGALVFGENAGNLDTKGQNTIVGDNSSQNLVNGIRNTIVGNKSFESNTTINNSTVIGYLANATENSYNAVAIGAESEAGNEAIQIGKGSNTESNTVQFGGIGGVNPIPINKFKVQTSTGNRDLLADIDGKSNLVDGNTFTGNQIINGTSGNTVTINNTGTGNSFVVEDSVSGRRFAVKGYGDVIIGSDTNNVTLNELGLKLNGTATVWEDDNLDPTTLAGGGVSPTSIIFASTTTHIAGFRGDGTDEVEGCREYPHKAKLNVGAGTSIVMKFHAHTYATTAVVGNSRWGLEYFWTAEGVAVTTSTTIYATVPTNGIAWAKKSFNFPDIVVPNEMGSQFHFRFFRLGGDVLDTYTAFIGVSTIGYHYEIDSLGSNEVLTK